MKHLFLHVGSHKTGTSSVQGSLHHNRSLLAEAGFHYLDGPPNHSGVMIRAFATDVGRLRPDMVGRVSDGARRVLRQRMSAFLASAPEGRFIISGEGMSRIDRPGIAEMLDFFQPQVDRITIVCFLRPPRSSIPSIMQQRLKTGITLERVARSAWPNYQGSLSKFLSHSKRAQVVTPIYAKQELVRGCTVATLLSVCGAPDELYERMNLMRWNSSLSRPAIALLAAANDTGGGLMGSSELRVARARLVRLLSRLPGASFRLPDEVTDAILCQPRVRKAFTWAEQHLGRHFGDFEAPAPSRGSRPAVNPADWLRQDLGALSANEARALRALLSAEAERAVGAARESWATLEARLERRLAHAHPEEPCAVERAELQDISGGLLMALRPAA